MNKILESISASLGELINRSFITAGLAPGLLLAIGWSLYSRGWVGTRSLVQEALASGDQFWPKVGWAVLIILVLAWIFVALKGVAQWAVANAPLGGLRDWLLGRQLLRLETAQKLRKTCLERYSALKWQGKGARFVIIRGALAAPTYNIAALKTATDRAQNLLDTAGRLRPPRVEELATALHPLWLASRWPTGTGIPQDIQDLLADWTAWMAQNPARLERLEAATTTARRAHNLARARIEALPKDPVWIRPTRFGNRLAAIDDYAETRYGIDTSTLWVRLWGVLGQEERNEFRHAEQGVAALVNTAAAFFVLAVGVATAEVAEGVRLLGSGLRPDLRAIAFLAGSALLAYAAYSGAVVSLGGLKEVMSRWIDLKRLALLKALGHEAPRTVAEERALFGELRPFFVQASGRRPSRKLISEKA